MSSFFDILSGLFETKESMSNIKEPETVKAQEKTDAEEMTQVKDVMEEVCREDKNTQNVPEVATVPEAVAEPETPLTPVEAEEESLDDILSNLSFAERKEVMRSNFLRIWEEKAQEYYEEKSTQSIEETNKRISTLEGTIAKERQQLQELQKKVDDYSELNQLMKLGGKHLPVEKEKAQIENIKSNLEIKERELAELQAGLEKNHCERLEQALDIFLDDYVSDGWSSEKFKEEYDGYRERFIESTEYIRGLCKSPLYQKIQKDDEKHLVDSYIRWADIQNRIIKLFVNPARIYEDGSYELNLDFKNLYHDICNHPFDVYNVNYRAERWLNGFCSDIPYVKYLLIIREYIREYCCNRIAGITDCRNSVRNEVSCYIQCMQFDCIIFNQFFRECQKNGTDYNEIFGAYEQEFDRFMVDIEEVWRKDGEIKLWSILWDGFEVEDELIEYLFDVDMYTLHDVNRYIAMYLQFSLDYTFRVFNISGGTYLYYPYNAAMPETGTDVLRRQCAKDLGIEAYKLRKSLSCLAPSRISKRVAFHGTKGAQKFLEDEVKKCQNI